MTNPEIIKERLKEIDENLKILAEFAKIPANKFIAETTTYKAAERCLELSIQCVLDICHHIIAENNWPRPKDNQEAILVIGQHKVIPLAFAKRISPMAGLRNILVHEYIKINPAIIHKHLSHLQDFRQFQKYIFNYLKKIA